MLTAVALRDMVRTVAEAHTDGITWYSISSEATDKPTAITYPMVAWADPSTSTARDTNGLYRRQLRVEMLVVAQTASDRTPEQEDSAHSGSEKLATDIAIEVSQLYADQLDVSDITTSTVIDRGANMETGVILRFTVSDLAGLCTVPGTFTY